ncbi:Serine/Threonine-kinase [Perilla frutescens var. hirtella]|uniref:Serine/Threonine-kinase n=1 Tax=Perilla frutescens var. hirtella TaxID=608512 RepID=A0AAD4ILZ0_PERFH|nr:Serine/Threonine-kinase [Perilla frutescens var. hirtella]
MNKKITELEPSTSRKRRRREESEPQSENDVENSLSLSLEENFTFSDTLMALRMMCAHFPHIQKVSVPPFVLQSQLYSSIKDRTEVDREIESLRRDRVVRIFKLNTGQDDHAIMFTDDYINQIERVVKRMEENKQNDLVVFEWFKTHVLQSKLDTSIGHQELWSFLSLGGKVKEEHISQLINAGLLIRQLIDQNMYWFSIPNIGSVLKGLSQGRKELLSLLSRKKYKEMMMTSLETKRMRFSPLDMRFHLRDLIGSGHLKTIQTPSGLIVRVAND